MSFYSTKSPDKQVSLKEAVLRGLPPDNGLYMPAVIPKLPESFFQNLPGSSMLELSRQVAAALLADEIPQDQLEQIVSQAINFDAPLVSLTSDLHVLELFHGPTLAFKDFGARFMAQLMSHFQRGEDDELLVLVATSGDTGSAVANGFYGVEGIKVVLLYPSGKVSPLQEKQLTTLGGNVSALEIEGVFDDCQALVKQAFLDTELTKKLKLTSANSINIARLIPQSFYYFRAFAQLKDPGKEVVFCVPSGNFGNLTAGLIAKRMGLPIKRFVAATNVNDVVPQYLTSSNFKPRSSIQTLSNAMDVGNPSNFARILDLYGGDHARIVNDIAGFSVNDRTTTETVKNVYERFDYLIDPHGAVGVFALKQALESELKGCQGVVLETAHPAKFIEVVEEAVGFKPELPAALKECQAKQKNAELMPAEFSAFKEYLLNLQ